MKNFITWLTEQLNKEDGVDSWTKEITKDYLSEIHSIIISDDDDESVGRHYGDCTKQNITCEFCMYQNWLDRYEKYCRDFIKQKYESNT